MKKELIASAALVSLVLGVPSLNASTNIKAKSIQKEVSFQNKNFKVASQDIQKGLNDTLNAISLLSKNRNKAAKKDLSDATMYFAKALKVDPKLGLVPIEENTNVYSYRGDPKNIKEAISLAKKLLNKHDLQFARDVLSPLKDEITVTTHYIPMDVYPNVTKIASKLLSKGKNKEALQELSLGLSTIVSDRAVMPIPLLTSQELVLIASKGDKTDKKKASKFLKRAKIELQKAVLLGYASKHSSEYKSLEKKIDAIQKEIKGKNEVKKLYDDIKGDFESLIHKTRGEKKAYDPNSVWDGTKKSHTNATNEEDKDVVKFAQKSKADAF